MMKKLLLIAGVVIIIAGVIALLFSALQRFGYYHLLDGEADMYKIALENDHFFCNWNCSCGDWSSMSHHSHQNVISNS